MFTNVMCMHAAGVLPPGASSTAEPMLHTHFKSDDVPLERSGKVYAGTETSADVTWKGRLFPYLPALGRHCKHCHDVVAVFVVF